MQKPAPFTGEWLIHYDSFKKACHISVKWVTTGCLPLKPRVEIDIAVKSVARDQISAWVMTAPTYESLDYESYELYNIIFKEEGSGVELHNIRSRSKRNALELYPDNAADEN